MPQLGTRPGPYLSLNSSAQRGAAATTDTETFVYWATQMIDMLKSEDLEAERWFARVNSILVSF